MFKLSRNRTIAVNLIYENKYTLTNWLEAIMEGGKKTYL